MTVIVWRNGIMAADTLSYIHNGECRMPGEVQKIWRLANGSLLGHAGVRRQAHALMRWVEEGEKGEPPDTGEVTAILAERGGRLRLFDGKSERDHDDVPFYAIGSGAQVALGALYQGATAIQAAQIACLVSPYCGGNIRFERIGGD